MINQFKTQVKLNVLPLGSYDVLIGMDCLEKHQVILNYFQKIFTFWTIKDKELLLQEFLGKYMLDRLQPYRWKKL